MRRALGQVKGYSPGIVVPEGRMLLISGMIAMDASGNIVGAGNVTEQARFVFAEIANLIGEAGGSMADVVKITTYLTDMTRYSEFAAVRAETFPGPDKPASAAVGVAALVDPGLLIEIEAIAVLQA
jgi:enamine deaminase RidA (YjgF/YER057c/UK114 family)